MKKDPHRAGALHTIITDGVWTPDRSKRRGGYDREPVSSVMERLLTSNTYGGSALLSIRDGTLDYKSSGDTETGVKEVITASGLLALLLEAILASVLAGPLLS